MRKAKDFRQEAWQKLSGKWGMAAVLTLVYTLVIGACGFTGILLLLVSGPAALSLALICLKVVRFNEQIKIEDLLKGFNNFVNSLLLWLINSIFTFLWSLLLVVPGIIKSYSYSMSFYILADNPDMDFTSVRKRSIEMMRGNKWRLFCLDLSFIGWLILCVLTFGILTFWVTPYQQTARAAFYQSLLEEQNAATQHAAPAGETVEVPSDGAPADDVFGDLSAVDASNDAPTDDLNKD